MFNSIHPVAATHFIHFKFKESEKDIYKIFLVLCVKMQSWWLQ